MTPTEAVALHLKWFGTAGTRKPPTDEQLRRILGVTRAMWEESEALVAVERAKPRVQIFVCGKK